MLIACCYGVKWGIIFDHLCPDSPVLGYTMAIRCINNDSRNKEQGTKSKVQGTKSKVQSNKGAKRGCNIYHTYSTTYASELNYFAIFDHLN